MTAAGADVPSPVDASHGELPAWLSMLHSLGEAAWIVDAATQTLPN